MHVVRALAFAQCLAVSLAAPALAQSEVRSAPPGAEACTGCHGLDGDAPFPIQQYTAEEITAALAGFRDGTRVGTLMPRLAKGFDDEESHAIAEWFAAQGAK